MKGISGIDMGIIGVGTILIDLVCALSVVAVPLTLVPAKRSKWRYPLVFFSVWFCYFILELLGGIEERGSIYHFILFEISGFLEFFVVFGTCIACATGNIWKTSMVTMIFTQFISISSSIVISFFPELDRPFNSYIVDYISPPVTSALIVDFIYVVLIVVSSFLFRFIFSVNGYSRSKVWKPACMIYLISSATFGTIRNIYYNMEANGELSAEQYRQVFAHFITMTNVVIACNLIGYLYNRMEMARILREQNELKESIYKNPNIDFTTGVEGEIHSGNAVIDHSIQEIYHWAEDNGTACEITMNHFYDESFVLDEYEVMNLFKNIQLLVQSRQASHLSWMACHVRWNQEMMMVCLEFNQRKGFRRSLRNCKEFQGIYDILSLHDGMLNIRKDFNSYIIEMMLFDKVVFK